MDAWCKDEADSERLMEGDSFGEDARLDPSRIIVGRLRLAEKLRVEREGDDVLPCFEFASSRRLNGTRARTFTILLQPEVSSHVQFLYALNVPLLGSYNYIQPLLGFVVVDRHRAVIGYSEGNIRLCQNIEQINIVLKIFWGLNKLSILLFVPLHSNAGLDNELRR